MDCIYCNKTINNKGSLKAHEKYCKLNPNREIKQSYFTEYNKKIKEGKIVKKYTNQYNKAKALGLEISVSSLTKSKISKANKNKIWTEDRKQKHSEIMKLAVKTHQDSYTKNNVIGRVKNIDYKGTKLKGSWELLFAQWLDKNNIAWKHEVKGFEYEWNGTRLYYPDFYLPELDVYVEIKGYETERDRIKWKAVSNLIVVKKKGIEEIKKGIFQLAYIGSRS